jgi:hypothetical protein
MQTIPSLSERLTQVDNALDVLCAEHQPTGLIQGGETLVSLGDLELSAIGYAGVLAFCGKNAPKTEESKPGGLTDTLPLETLTAQIGSTSLFGLAGFVLKNSVQEILRNQGHADEEGNLRYTVPSGPERVLDSGLGSGCMVMGMMLDRIAALARGEQPSREAYIKLAKNSLASLPVAFAKIPNSPNRKLEILYGLRSGGAYDRTSAADELQAGDPDQYSIALNAATNRVAPTNWQAAHPMPFTSTNVCGGLHSRVFGKMWNHLITATSNLPELFPKD